MEGNNFAERLTYKKRGDFDLEELEKLHKFLIGEIAAHFGAPAAVKVLGKALLNLNFEEAQPGPSTVLPQVEAIESNKESFCALKGRWKKAHEMLVEYPDMWVARGVHLKPLLRGIRRRWNAQMREWGPDEDVTVKMDDIPFGAGAMRECYAMKKLSSHTTHRDWKRALNLVAKRYMNANASRQVYYEDVKLQMDSKLLGELYNSCRPPKKVDFISAQLYEVVSGPQQGLYCVESLIEGEYVKHNSNSGFVDDEAARNTPQAFSHWSYCYTNGEKIVVDIQGVGDLYTDPQIHTRDGKGYGTGNLGPRGIALFFRAHTCNAICSQLGLEPFQRCDADVKCSMSRASSLSTGSGPGMARGTVTNMLDGLSPEDIKALEDKVKQMNNMGTSVATMLSKAWQKQEMADMPSRKSDQALIHWEVAKLHGEAVLLPELHKNISLADSIQGGLFHLFKAASGGCALACCVLARVYYGLPPSMNQVKGLVESAQTVDGFEMVEDPELAIMYTKMASGKGVRNASLSLAMQKMSGEDADCAAALELLNLGLKESEAEFPEAEEEASVLPGASRAKHEIYAALAELYGKGGPGVERSPEKSSEYYGIAADEATAVGKGKAAAKYYELQAAASS